MRGTGSRGLTLVEVLVAVALTAVAATCVYGTVATAGRVRDRLEAAQQRREASAAARHLLARDLRSAVFVEDDENFVFLGEDYVEGSAAADSLQFVTCTNDPLESQRPTSDLCQVQYFLDLADDTPEVGLVRRGLAFPIPEDEEQQEQFTDTMELVPTARELDILYFYGETGEWLDEWEAEMGLPDAVKLTLVVGDDEEPSEDEAEDVRLYSLLVHLAADFTVQEQAGAGEEPAGPGEEGEPGAAGAPGGGPTAPGMPTAPGGAIPPEAA